MRIYPSRINTEKTEQIKNQPTEVCSCGHGRYRHSSDENRPCNVCICPKYEFEQMLKLKEIWELEDHIRKNIGEYSQ